MAQLAAAMSNEVVRRFMMRSFRGVVDRAAQGTITPQNAARFNPERNAASHAILHACIRFVNGRTKNDGESGHSQIRRV
jgi:hypothetical protein